MDASWIPAITSSAVVATLSATAGWALKLLTEKQIQSAFDLKLERVRAEGRQNDEQLRADLRSKETQLESLRKNALSGAAARQALVDKRRVEAVDRLWSHICVAGSAKFAVQMMQFIQIDQLLKMCSKGEGGTREFVKIMHETAKFDDILKNTARAEQPYVLPSAWSYYTAHQAIISYVAAVLGLAKSGLAPELINKPNVVNKLIAAALPHQQPFLEEFPQTAMFHLIEELEANLLASLRESLSGKEADEAMIKQAAQIDRIAQQLAQDQMNMRLPNALKLDQ